MDCSTSPGYFSCSGHNTHLSNDETLCQILKEAQHRWLRPPEVCEILHNYRKFELTPNPPHKPQSGSLFLFDRKVLRYFRKDGYNWRKKKDGRTVREAHERLKAGSVEVLHCYYAHGEDNENFQRRSYWMLDTNEHIVLVHYREVKEGSKTGLRSPNNYLIQGSSMGNPRSILATISPQSSPLVSPGSSSPNTSTDWNGTTFSSECDGPECIDDVDQNSRDFSAKSDMKWAMNSGRFQASPSVVMTNPVRSSHESKVSVPSDDIGGRSGTQNQTKRTVESTQKTHIKQENGDIRNPRVLDSSEWCETVRQNNSQKSFATNGTMPSSTSNELKDSFERIVNQGSTIIHSNTKGNSFSTQLETDPVAFTDIFNSQKSSWNASLDEFNYTGQNSSSFESDVLYELQKAQTYPNLGRSCDGQSISKLDSADQKSIPLVESYVNVFRDFQAEIPTEDIHYDAFKKYENLGKWINQDKGEDIDTMLQFSSDITYWANTLVEEDTNSTENMQLDAKLPSPSQDEYCFKILDISPNHASSAAGAKVLIAGCFSDIVEDPSKFKWCCMFGDVKVHAEYLQPGALRCNAPPHLPGKIQLYVTRDDEIVCSESKEFEYIADSKLSSESSGQTPSHKMDLLFQIRLARMLSKEIPIISQCTKPEEMAKDLLSALKSLTWFEEWERMEEELNESNFLAMNLKERFIEKLLKEKLKKWLLKRLEDGGKCAAVLDDNGLGVLHLGAALGYTWVIGPMLAAGVKINFRDSRGWTALHWAAQCGRESMVVVLLANGADPGAKTDPTSAFPAGQTPADLAAAENHKGIAGYLAESSLTTHLSLLSLKTDVDESVLTDDAVETLSEKIVRQPNAGESQEQLSLQDSLSAARNAAQAVARIQLVFRAQSFKKKQESCSIEENDYGISNEEAQCIVAAQKSTRSGLTFDDGGISHAAAIRIQQKYRGWKGRRTFLLFRQHVVKIQAHFRGQQVRKRYKKIVWSVSIVEKAILRWRRKGRGLRGFESTKLKAQEQQPGDADDDFLKAGRKQMQEGLAKALARVHSMVKYPEARDQYRRLLEGYQKTKGQLENGPSMEQDFSMTTD